MKKLEDLSIQQRLSFALLILVSVFVGFGILTLVKLQRLVEVTHNIYEDPLRVSSASKEARLNIVKVQRNMKDLILLEDIEEIRKERLNLELMENDVLKKVEEIYQNTTKKETLQLNDEVRRKLFQWRKLHEEMMQKISQGKKEEAKAISKGKSKELVEEIEEKLMQIDENSNAIVIGFIEESDEIREFIRVTLVLLIVGLGCFLYVFFRLIAQSIVKPIIEFQSSINQSTLTGVLYEIHLKGKNEIVDIANNYNKLIGNLKKQSWLKDHENGLRKEVLGVFSIKEFTQKALNYLSRTLDAGKGVFYIYDEESKKYVLESTFAFIEESLKKDYALGEGIVGQVALEKKSIFLKNILEEKQRIQTGTVSGVFSNTYTFPLLYRNEVYGVIEIVSFEVFDEKKEEFLKKAAGIIAIHLYSILQNNKIVKLLHITEKSRIEAKRIAKELEKNNLILEIQQTKLQQQSEELQQSNMELEEQHQILQQQSEELQQANAQMEEQQQALEDQAKLLSIKNEELEKSKEELIHHSKQIELSNKYKSEFLANISHELRTPLNSIILLSNLLLRKKHQNLKKEEIERISIINSAGKELLERINDILDLSKMEAGKMSLNKIYFHTKDLIKELKSLFGPMAEEKGIKFSIQDNVNNEIYGDKEKISQILRNFISNGLKFTEKGYLLFQILQREENKIIFLVEDTGIGIHSENISRIFEEFQQEDGSISRKFGGTGLGLSISKGLAEMMNAKIEVKSKVGKGSTFYLFLDNMNLDTISSQEDVNLFSQECAVALGSKNINYLSNQNEDKISAKDENFCFYDNQKEEYLISRDNMKYGIQLENKKVLIIDEDIRNRFVLASALEEYGAEIIEAKEEEIVLKKLSKNNVDLILINIMMPIMDGFGIIKKIRRQRKVRDIPIIAIIEKTLKEEDEKYILSDVNDSILKPVDCNVLLSTVMKWINK